VRREGHAGESRVRRKRLTRSQRTLNKVAGEGDVDADSPLVVARPSLDRSGGDAGIHPDHGTDRDRRSQQTTDHDSSHTA